jgi:hypothetical protein
MDAVLQDERGQMLLFDVDGEVNADDPMERMIDNFLSDLYEAIMDMEATAAKRARHWHALWGVFGNRKS